MSLRLTDKFLGGEHGAASKGAMPKKGKPHADHWDTAAPGLGVRVSKTKKRKFILRYRFNGKNQIDTLQPIYPALTLGAARAEANQTALDVQAGRNPRLSDREPRKHYAPKREGVPGSYAEAVAEYVRRYQEGKAQNKTAGEVKRALLKFGDDWEGPISKITARDIRAKLEAVLDAGSGYMANRYFSYLGTFFSWCAEPGIEFVETSPMLGLKKPWDGEASRDRFYDDDEIAAIWKAADKEGVYAGALIKIMLLTGKRRTAQVTMKWSEIDENGLWTPPPDLKLKRGNKQHNAIPLPGFARQIIGALPKVAENDFVFRGDNNNGKPLVPGTNIKRRIQKASGVDDFYYHALRRTVKTGLGKLGVPPHIKQVVLGHAMESGAGAGYDHYDYNEEKAEALEAWADHVQGVLVAKGVWQENVIPIGG
jgi:integrase